MFTAKQQGFTLLEMLTTTTVLSILIATAIPNLSQYIARSAASSDINQLNAIVSQARSAAISQGTHITVCRLESTLKCDRTEDWKGAISLFSDSNKNGILETSDQLIQTIDIGTYSSSLKWRAFNNRGYIQFSPTGLTTTSNGTFTYCTQQHETFSQLSINRQGRVRKREVSLTNIPC